MYIHITVYVCVPLYLCVFVFVCILFARACMHVCVCKCACMCVCTCVYVSSCMCACMYLFVYACAYVCALCMCMCACVSICRMYESIDAGVCMRLWLRACKLVFACVFMRVRGRRCKVNKLFPYATMHILMRDGYEELCVGLAKVEQQPSIKGQLWTNYFAS